MTGAEPDRNDPVLEGPQPERRATQGDAAPGEFSMGRKSVGQLATAEIDRVVADADRVTHQRLRLEIAAKIFAAERASWATTEPDSLAWASDRERTHAGLCLRAADALLAAWKESGEVERG